MKKALIVDDNKDNLYLLETLMNGYGFKTISASNGAEALGLALNDRPDIIIADILMPVMDGYKLCREWKKDAILKNIPFVFYTATYTHPKDEVFALSLGAEKFLIKPQEPDIFIAIINQVLDEFNAEKLEIKEPANISEITVLREYNETLIRKMEDRMLKSEEAEKKIRIYATQLEDEIEQRNIVANALKESEEKFRLITEKSADAIFVTDIKGKFLYVNEQVVNLLQYTNDEILEMTIFDILSKDKIDNYMEISTHLTFNENIIIELQFIKKDGKLLPVELNSVILPNGLIYGNCRDISARKLAEEALIEREEFLSSIIENIPDMIFIKDAKELKYFRINKAGEELIGLSKEELIGKNDYDFFPNNQADFFTQKDNEVLQSKKLFDIPEEPIDTKNGRRILHTKKLPLLDKDNNPSFLLGISQDITESKRVEQELIIAKNKAEESDHLKSAFLANMSHEIRTPLNGILGFSELLNDEDIPIEEIRQYTKIIQNSGNRLLETVNNILDMSKIQTGQVDLNNRTFPLNILMTDLYDFFLNSARSKGINFTSQCYFVDDKSLIFTDELKLNQILTNLLNNAIKFTQSGYIDFGYKLENNDLVFYVIDSGVGIAQGMENRIFLRFAQANLSLTRGFEGAGLGLSISKALVELLGGKIWFESVENKGTKFYFSIPYHPSNDLINTNNNENDISSNQKKFKILIAEDDETSFLFLQKLLIKIEEYSILHALDGEEAVTMYRNNPDIDLILMDIKMPVMNGIEATRIIKQINPEVPIIAQTAYAFSQERMDIMAAGCDDYLSKPIDIEKLKKILS